MKTDIIYYDNPDIIFNETKIIASGTDEHGFYIIPEETCYFSGGGGQEADKAKLFVNGKNIDIISGKYLNGTSRIYIGQSTEELAIGTSIKIEIDPETRINNSRLHSAGHLLSSVIFEEMKLDLIPIKGFHYNVGSHVEFSSSSGIREIEIDELNNRLHNNIESKLQISSEIVNVNSSSYAISFKTAGFTPTANTMIRLVNIGEFLAYSCGGTHVLNTSYLKGLKIIGYKSKKGNLRIKYGFG